MTMHNIAVCTFNLKISNELFEGNIDVYFHFRAFHHTKMDKYSLVPL